MDKNLTPEQRLLHGMLFTPGTTTHELVLSEWAEDEERELFIEYILDVLLAGNVKVTADEMSLDCKRGHVWRLRTCPMPQSKPQAGAAYGGVKEKARK